MKNTSADKAIQCLQSLEGCERAAAPSFLLTRIAAAVQSNQANQNGWNRLAGFLSKPGIALTAVLLLLALNFFLIINAMPKSSNDITQIDFQEDMAFGITNIIDFENAAP